MLNPEVDRVGIALVANRGVLYATADYSHGVQELSASQVEARVAELIRLSGVAILADPGRAPRMLAMESGMPRLAVRSQPRIRHALAGFGLDPASQSVGGSPGLRAISAGGCWQLSGPSA